MLTLAILIPSFPIPGMDVWVEENSYMLSSLVNAVASLVGVSFLLNDFLKEVAVLGEIDIDAGIVRQLFDFFRNRFLGVRALLLCVVFGVISAFALNAAIGVVMQRTLNEGRYETVEQIQYSVPLVLGLILYGLVSPLVEEIVFRGIIYNRIKRFYSITKAVIFSALLFGAFHANLPQFAYGTCMGVLIALCYERTGCFYAPLLFHAAANVAVFLTAFFGKLI